MKRKREDEDGDSYRESDCTKRLFEPFVLPLQTSI